MLTHRAVPAGIVLCLLATAATASTVLTRSPRAGATAARTPAVAATTASVTAISDPLADLREFRLAARRPAATVEAHRLPKVHLAQLTVTGIPPVALSAYRAAARQLGAADSGCRLSWWLIAGIGFIESGHAASGGSHVAGWNGVARPPIRGPVLDGSHGFKAIRDTDGGLYDGDRTWDRAVGPMQFLPSTWRVWGPPGNLRGHADPQNIRAAASATAHYLCASGLDLAQPHAMALAVFSYNHSFDYVRLVLSVGARYAGMTADQLGVNLLPTDRAVKQHQRAAKHARHPSKRSHRGASAAGSGGTSSASGGSNPTPSPSPTTTTASSPAPSPSPSPQQPLPSPTLPTLPPPSFP